MVSGVPISASFLIEYGWDRDLDRDWVVSERCRMVIINPDKRLHVFASQQQEQELCRIQRPSPTESIILHFELMDVPTIKTTANHRHHRHKEVLI